MSGSFPDLLKEKSEAKDDRKLIREETDGFWLVRFLGFDVCNSNESGGKKKKNERERRFYTVKITCRWAGEVA